MTTTGLVLEPHVRGDTFVYTTTLGNSWLAADFTAGIRFTLRRVLPATSVVTDADAVDQASVAGGEIVAVGAALTITIPAARTTLWPAGPLYWDLQGSITIGARVYTIASGTIRILSDVTRSV
jgi:hypothetical protein